MSAAQKHNVDFVYLFYYYCVNFASEDFAQGEGKSIQFLIQLVTSSFKA